MMKNKTLRFRVPPEIGYDDEQLTDFLQKKVGGNFRVIRRSIDARVKQPVIDIEVAVFPTGNMPPLIDYTIPENSVADQPTIIIIGAGPAGLFAGLKCLEYGLKPVIIERGKDVRGRRRDLAAINKAHIVNPESNYCFGEGGAG
ncbi:MAG: FAD-binding protein, partial [Cyclobacteriaceae bacterium]